MPRFDGLFLIFTLSSIALPLTNGFVGEFLILIGSFTFLPLATMLASLGVVLGAVYMLSLYQKMMFGELDRAANESLPDLTLKQVGMLAPFVVLVFYLGIFPGVILDTIEPTVKAYQREVYDRRGHKPNGEPPSLKAPENSVPSLQALQIDPSVVSRG